MKTLLTTKELSTAVDELARKINAAHTSFADVVLVGIQQGGVVLADHIVEILKKLSPSEKIEYGKLDITFYRDDIRKEVMTPDVMHLPFSIENKQIVLIDDVLFTGRTIKAALDALLDYGRPSRVELCVLIDRNEHRQFPIQADYVGVAVKTKRTDKIKLVDGEVVLLDA